jgi:hypothetical protein
LMKKSSPSTRMTERYTSAMMKIVRRVMALDYKSPFRNVVRVTHW